MSIDAVFNKIKDSVQSGHWMVIGVGASHSEDYPHYCYTVGLHSHGLPEIILFGLPMETGQSILNTAADQVLNNGTALPHGTQLDKVASKPLVLVDVPESEKKYELTNMVRQYYRSTNYRLQQLVMPDKQGRFPWQKSVDPKFLRIQPLLGGHDLSSD